MSLRPAVIRHSAASRENPAAKPVAGARPVVRVEPAAKDDTALSAFGDPLAGMAVASVILFAILAALIAFG